MSSAAPATVIHPTAIVQNGAVLGPGCEVGPYCIVGSRVRMGARNRLLSHVVLDGNTTLGDDNQLFHFAAIGSIPQDLKFRGEDSRLEIGSRNIIREYVTLQPGTSGGGMLTRIGDGNLFMANSHVGHDSLVGNGNIIANSVGISGHVVIGDRVTIGGLSGIHQFVRLGDLAFLAGGTMVVKDIPPYCTAQGDRAGLAGLNKVGMERAGLSRDDIALVRRLYRELFIGAGTLTERLQGLLAQQASHAVAGKFLQFIASSERGVTQPRSRAGDGE